MFKKISCVLFTLFFLNHCLAATNSTDEKISNLLETSAALNHQQKLIYLSGTFLHTTYLNEPLGEGQNGEFNQEPLYRLDAFDCQTYVSTLIALALSTDLKQFQSIIANIDYQNHIISFATRNHFPSADWIPSNIKNNYIEAITTHLANHSDIELSKITIDKPDWFKKLGVERIKIDGASLAEQNLKLQQLHALGNQAKLTPAMIEYISLEKIFQNKTTILNIIGKIPNGAIIVFIKNNPNDLKNFGTLDNVSHMGFVIWENGTPYLRAASLLKGKVVDLPLISYLYAAYTQNSYIEGIAIYQIK